MLRWSEIASARGKTVHTEMQIEALIDDLDVYDYDRWKAISVGGGEWSPPNEWLEDTEALALASILRPFSASEADAWFMLWDGWGDLGPGIDGIPRGVIHPDRSDAPVGELLNGTWALRHYLVVRGPLDSLSDWFRWRMEAPNYWWPDDRASIVATEIDGFSTYVGGSQACVDAVLDSPLLEALPSAWPTASTSAVIRPTCHGRSHRRVASGQNDLRRKRPCPACQTDGRRLSDRRLDRLTR